MHACAVSYRLGTSVSVILLGNVHVCRFFADIAEYGGAEADHESGDGSDQLEERGNQVQEK